MPKENDKILEHNHGEKPMKILFIIYGDTEPLLEKINMWHSNPKSLWTAKINLHTICGCPLFMYCTFNTTKNRLDYYRGKDYMKNFCKYWKK